jgi:hypothetical protein
MLPSCQISQFLRNSPAEQSNHGELFHPFRLRVYMTELGLFLIAFLVLVGWLVCLTYREIEQDFPVRRGHRH